MSYTTYRVSYPMSNLQLFVGAGFVLTVFVLAIMTNWRSGVPLTVLTALLQDPLRKLVVGEPVWITLLSVSLFVVTVFSFVYQNKGLSLSSIAGWHLYIKVPATFFVTITMIQIVHGYINFGNPIVSMMGFVTYVAPFAAMIVGYHYGKEVKNVNNYLKAIIAICGISAFSIYLEASGISSPIFGSVGVGINIHRAGINLEDYSGLFRSSEVASWYMVTGVCLCFVYVMIRPKSRINLLIFLLIGLMVIAALLTGRRKVIIQLLVFLFISVFLAMYYRRGAQQLTTMSIVTIVVGTTLIYQVEDLYLLIKDYLTTSSTLLDDTTERGILGFSNAGWVTDTHGLWGIGAGAATQGARHFGLGDLAVGAYAESGPALIMLELGLPGVLATVWLLLSMFLHVKRIADRIAKIDQTLSLYLFGLVAYLVSNVASYSVAKQVFGDATILVLIALTVGMLFSVPDLAEKIMASKEAKNKELSQEDLPGSKAV